MKHINVFRILAAVLLPSLLAALAPAAPALAEGETISLSASQGAIGQVITVSGSGFYASNTTAIYRGVNILFGRYPGATGATMDYSAFLYQKVLVWPLDSDGTFQATFTVPPKLTSGTSKEDVAQGNYYVYLTEFFPGPPDPVNGLAIIQIKPFAVVVPAITLSPVTGAAGTEVTVSGTYFGVTEGITVKYDGLPVNFTGSGLTSSSGAVGPAKITIPSGISGPHTITVSGNSTGTTAQATFTVKPKLTISPATGPAGTLIAVSGSGFGRELDVTPTFGGNATTPGKTDVNGTFSLPVPALPKAAGSYDVIVTDSAGNTDKASFNLTVGTINISPSSGNAGTEVSITGSNVLPGHPITITFNDAKVTPATSDAQGGFSAAFTVPALATGTYKVKVNDGSNTNETEFEITASVDISPETSLASPGHVGSQLAITGDGFTAGGTVTITYDGDQIATTTVKTDRSFSATFDAPPGSAGEHTVVATDGTISRPFTFIMESTPPAIPAPLKPEMNIQADQKTRFDWQDVTDPSGVTYNLQVATKEDFSASSLVFEKTGLTQSEYTLTGQQRLESTGKEAPYYWRVEAVDGAGNKSDWSGTGAFSVGGLLTLSQPVIYLIIGFAAVLLAILGFWLGRRTAYY